jgi:hypothetical protein
MAHTNLMATPVSPAHALPCIVGLLLVLAWAAPCQAQSFALPVDIEQGLVIGAAKPRTPYLFGVRVVPSLDIERARFGLVLGPMYRNPEWDFALGANMALFVPTSGKDTGLRFVVQGEYLPRTQVGRISIGAVAELLGMLRIGLWPGFDFDVMRPELCISLGADVMSWAKALSDDW